MWAWCAGSTARCRSRTTPASAASASYAATDAGKALLFDLALQADIVVLNFRPQVAERLGVGYAGAVRAQPGAGLCVDQRLRRGRPLCRLPGLGLGDAGRQRPHATPTAWPTARRAA
ncbi:CoA transferase [Cupriavidus basilensis]